MRIISPKPSNALYVHIPFCAHLCYYCDFTKRVYDRASAARYLEALFAELAEADIPSVATLYIGGGTPTALDDDLLERLLARLAPLLRQGGEFTLEANVENLTDAKLALLVRYGVNRLSIGVETFDDAMLEGLNRKHTGEDAERTVRRAQQAGLTNLNLDLMYGLPLETLPQVLMDVRRAIALGVPHLSAYALSVFPGTLFGRHHVPEAESDDLRTQYDAILAELRAAGYERYEVSNFAKPGFRSRHNLTYWNDETYVGLGLGASGYLGKIRYTNTTNFATYLSGDYVDFQETLTPELEEEDFLMLKLRLAEGFTLADYAARFHADFTVKYAAEIRDLTARHLLNVHDGSVYPSDDGIMLLDFMLVRLLKTKEASPDGHRPL